MKRLAAVIGIVIMVVGAAVAAGYAVDRTRTQDLRQVLHEADSLATAPPRDDALPYFTMHNDLAAAAGAEPCSAFAVRMTQRFLPEGWTFDEGDVAAINAGEDVPELRVHTGGSVPVGWQC